MKENEGSVFDSKALISVMMGASLFISRSLGSPTTLVKIPLNINAPIYYYTTKRPKGEKRFMGGCNALG